MHHPAHGSHWSGENTSPTGSVGIPDKNPAGLPGVSLDHNVIRIGIRRRSRTRQEPVTQENQCFLPEPLEIRRSLPYACFYANLKAIRLK